MSRARLLAREARAWWAALLRAVPGETGCALRRRLSGLGACGAGTRILSGVRLYHPGRIRLGARVGIAAGCQLNGAGGLTVGDDCLIGPGAVVWTENHRYADPAVPVAAQGSDPAPVTLGPDCWVAAGAVVLPGVTLGRGTVVAAGAVVTKSTEPYAVVAGVPARVVGRRGEPRV